MLSRIARRAEALARRAVELEPMPQPPLRPTRYPVVLLHGFGALANAMQGGILHEEAMALRAHGVAAYAPHVNPYDTIDVRASAWARRFGLVLEETGADKLNLIAFSSGGLDARVLAMEFGWADRIASLVTIATPHRGTALADYVLDQPDRLRTLAVGVMDFFGQSAYELEAPHAEDALHELTPAAVASRFSSDETIPGTWCGSFTGHAGKGTDVPMYPPLVVPNRILYGLAGINDGIVPTESMSWGQPLGLIEADHARQIGIRVPGTRGHNSKVFFLELAERLRAQGL